MEQIHYCQLEPHFHLIDAYYQQFSFQRHYHLDFHIGLVTQGAQVFRYRGQAYMAQAGEIILMPPDELHDGESVQQQGYQVKVFALSPGYLAELAGLPAQPESVFFDQLVVKDSAVFSDLVRLHLCLNQHPLSSLVQDGLLLEGFQLLFERYGIQVHEPARRLGRRSLQELKDYFIAHLDQPVRLTHLAQLCHLSPAQLQRHFKATTGMTPYAWFAQLRLEQGMKRLQYGARVADVAQQVGFYDQAHFCKAFKRQYGIAPSFVCRTS